MTQKGCIYRAFVSFFFIGVVISIKFIGRVKQSVDFQIFPERKTIPLLEEDSFEWSIKRNDTQFSMREEMLSRERSIINHLIGDEDEIGESREHQTYLTTPEVTTNGTEKTPKTARREEISRSKQEDYLLQDTNTSSSLRQIPRNMIEFMAPEIVKYIGKDRLTNLKNPCWRSRTGQLNCVPYFFLLGVTKCGTSDIYQKLALHPQIVSGINKESHWWTQRRCGENRRMFRARASFEKELSRGVRFLDSCYKNRKYCNQVIGDGSPSTFWDNHNWRTIFPNNTEGPPYVIADLIHAIDPEAKLIVSFRDPVERMFSSYKFFSAKPSPEAFHEALLKRLSIFHKCLEFNSLRACAYQDVLNFTPVCRDKPVMQLRMGIYHVFLEDWYQVYPKEQLFILELSDWQQNCQSILPKLYRFLELDPVSDKQIKSFCQHPAKNKGKHESKPMLAESRALLEEFYKPYNKRLYEILKDPNFLWEYS